MILEELKQMSNEALDDLSAVKVMGWEDDGNFIWINNNPSKNYPNHIGFTSWNPTRDMNDAINLIKGDNYSIRHIDGKYEVILNYGNPSMFAVSIPLTGDDLCRTITIASILAKGE